MQATATLILALGLAADAFAVSVASGLKIKYVKVRKALKIAIFFGGFQAIMPLIGWLAGLSLRTLLSAISHWVAFCILCLLGGKMIYESYQEDEQDFNPLCNSTLLALAIGTSIDALAVGLGFALIDNSIFTIVTAIGFVTFWLTFFGVFIGNKFGNLFQNKIEIVGGGILIAIGSKILIENLVKVTV
jgi:putative Mn2+ efflux pump MntP